MSTDSIIRDGDAAGLPQVIVVAGPTATGKTALGIALAKRFDGEVINADSRYLYRDLTIGVAKPDFAERDGVPHHVVDVCDASDEMSLATYQELAYAAIADVLGHGRVPILVGGTPLYLNAVVEGWRIPRVPPNPALRAQLEAEAQRDGLPVLADRLARIDPSAAERSGRNLRRVIRALEIYEATGHPMSNLTSKGPRPYQTLEIGLWMPRPHLHRAVDDRVDEQIAKGLVDEVQGLLEAGIDPAAPAMSSLGYRQLLPYLAGDITLAEAIGTIKTETHRYVRHQETWLRRNARLVRFNVTTDGWEQDVFRLAGQFLRSNPDFEAIPSVVASGDEPLGSS